MKSSEVEKKDKEKNTNHRKKEETKKELNQNIYTYFSGVLIVCMEFSLACNNIKGVSKQ